MPRTRTTHKQMTSGRHKVGKTTGRSNVIVRLFHQLPTWSRWIGAAAIVALYIYFFYYFFVGPFGFRWRALYGDINYPVGYEIQGIDISHHQGVINWPQLKADGRIDKYPVRFVMMKATEGANRVDENFHDNFFQSREYGFTRGVYHFYSVHSGANEQARFFIRIVQLENGDLPPVLDVENKPEQLSDQQFKDSVLLWLRTVERHYGVKPIVYTNHNFKLRYLSDAAFDEYPYWIAHYYVDKVQYPGAWKFWQYTDVGRIAGIHGSVDFNVYNGSFYDLRKMTIGSREQIGEDAYKD